jgi:ankyrin repeat protein
MSFFGRLGMALIAMTLLASPVLANSDLMSAIEERNLSDVRAALDAGADPNRKVEGGLPLNVAVLFGNLEIITLLLDNGADPDLKNGSGETALMQAAKGGLSQPVEVYAGIIRLLLERGADPNIKGQGTALANSIHFQKPELTKVLLEGGANPNPKIEHFVPTPLTKAVQTEIPDLVRLLLEAGADPNAENKGGVPALMWAVTADHENLEIVRMLLAAGANPNVRALDGYPLLMVAIEELTNHEIIRALLDAGANPDWQNKQGLTAHDLLAAKPAFRDFEHEKL